MAVTAVSIVKRFDVIKDIGLDQVTGFANVFLDALLLQAANEGFGHRVVPAVAVPAHAGYQIVCLQEAQPVIAAIL